MGMPDGTCAWTSVTPKITTETEVASEKRMTWLATAVEKSDEDDDWRNGRTAEQSRRARGRACIRASVVICLSADVSAVAAQGGGVGRRDASISGHRTDSPGGRHSQHHIL